MRDQEGKSPTGVRVAALAIALLATGLLPYAVVSAAMSLLFYDKESGAFGAATDFVVGSIFLITALLPASVILAIWALFKPKPSLIWWSGGLAVPAILMNLWLHILAA